MMIDECLLYSYFRNISLCIPKKADETGAISAEEEREYPRGIYKIQPRKLKI